MLAIDEILSQVGGALREVATSDTVVGTPLKLGEVTLVPVSRVSLGLGGGGGEGEGTDPHHHGRSRSGQSGKGMGLGSGGGAKVVPVAIVAFTPKGVEVLAVPAKPCWLDKLADKIPDWIEKAAEAKGGSRC
jgi:uncharacterized spore protein YtfJ